jgi:hypothetical protein
VVSDIPTLVVNGALDMATPAESGALVMEDLDQCQNADLSWGLDARRYHPARGCSVDLTYNSTMYPDRPLNLSWSGRACAVPLCRRTIRLPDLSE